MSERAEQDEIGTILRPRRAEQEPAAPPSPAVQQTPPADPSTMRRAAVPAQPDHRERAPLVSDLDLNASVPHRAVPALGDWGPGEVPSTRAKKRARWVVPVAFAVVIGVVVFAWYRFFLMLG